MLRLDQPLDIAIEQEVWRVEALMNTNGGPFGNALFPMMARSLRAARRAMAEQDEAAMAYWYLDLRGYES